MAFDSTLRAVRRGMASFRSSWMSAARQLLALLPVALGFLPRATRDRVGRMPRRLAVELVQRLEHRGLWARYAEKRRRMQRRGPVTLLEQMEGRCLPSKKDDIDMTHHM